MDTNQKLIIRLQSISKSRSEIQSHNNETAELRKQIQCLRHNLAQQILINAKLNDIIKDEREMNSSYKSSLHVKDAEIVHLQQKLQEQAEMAKHVQQTSSSTQFRISHVHALTPLNHQTGQDQEHLLQRLKLREKRLLGPTIVSQHNYPMRLR